MVFFSFISIQSVFAISYTDTNFTGYWTLDVDGTERNLVNNLTKAGTPYLVTAGCEKGNCYMFIDNAGDKFTATITRANPVGMCAWINRTGSDNEEMYGVGWGTGDGALIIGDANANGGIGCNVQSSPWGSDEMERNKWYHICCYADGANNLLLYVNGSLKDTKVIAGNTGAEAFNIGNPIALYPWEGEFDEVMIINGSLTSADILALYNSYSYVPPAGIFNATKSTLLLNSTDGDYNAVYGSGVNVSGYLNVSGTFYIEQNGTLVGSGTAPMAFDLNWTTLPNGTANITVYFNWNGTHNASSSTHYVRIFKGIKNLYQSFNGSETNTTITYPAGINATAWTDAVGGTLTFLKNGSAISNPYYAKLGANDYNFTVSLTHQNYSATAVQRVLTVGKLASGLTPASSLGWIIFVSQTTSLSCSAGTFTPTPTLKVQSVTVSSPYVLTGQQGTYDVSCSITDTQNFSSPVVSNSLYVNPLISCTSNTTFAFNLTVNPTANNITTLNFTDLVNQSFVTRSLGDVYISGVTNTTVNFTGGYFLIVNHSGVSSFVVKFGNYFANWTRVGGVNVESVIAVTNYTQQNPYVFYNILDEMTGNYFVPPDAILTSIIQCSKGENYIGISNDTKALFASTEKITKASLRVKYTADMYYSRQFYPTPADAEVLNFYVSDAYKNALDRIDFQMLDPNYYSSKLQIFKNISNEAVVITEGYFDVSHFFSSYLLEDTDYYLRTINPTGTITDFGRISIVKPEVKPLGRSYLNLNPNAVLISDNLRMNAYTNATRNVIWVDYEDKLNQTNFVVVTIWYQNGTVFENDTYTTAIVNVEHIVPAHERNNTFTVLFTVSHQTLGNSPVKYSMTLGAGALWSIGASSILLQLFSLGSLTLIGGLATRENIIGGALITTIAFAIFIGIGWLTDVWSLFAFVIVMFILAIINYLQTKGD
jgi:hypothetical protein